MIESFFEKVIEELGATGLLVLGLYYILYRPLKTMTSHLAKINDELGKILEIYKSETDKKNG